jgi:F-type H+-transporting ATPase subunit gamma
MANLKVLKMRIASVKSTQKITKAMKMVAASRLRRARDRAEEAAPYADRMQRMLSTLAVSVVDPISAPALLVGNGKEDAHLLVVIGSDRGLCGGLNTALVKQVRLHADKLMANGKSVKIITVGKKAFEQLVRGYKDIIVERIDGLSSKKQISFDEIDAVAQKVIALFEAGEFDVCSVFYNTFKSALLQQPTMQQLIPLDLSQVKKKETVDAKAPVLAQAVYEYEPDEQQLLDALLPQNLAVQLFHGLLENSASEHGARMTAMDSATRNAGDMIKRLTLVYNRTRQAAITTELTEIISGAESLNG